MASVALSESIPDSDDEAVVDPVPWDCIDVLVRGAPLLKFGRQGEPHFRDFQLSLDCTTLAWASSKKATGESQLSLRGVQLLEGQQSDVFLRQPRPDLADVSFTLVYDDPSAKRGTKRTLDVACKNRQEYETWVVALSYLITHAPPEALLEARRNTLWSDVVPLTGSEAPGRPASSLRITQALKKRLKEGNDVVVFGRSNWGQLGMGDESARLEPCLLNPFLGKAIRAVAVGTSHCLALSITGECYAWGNGGCGRLGTGGTDHELSPRQLLQPGGREPWRFRAVACGDMHTLAVSQEGGHAYAWGAGSVGALGCGTRDDRLVPTPVRAFLAGQYPAGPPDRSRVFPRPSMAEGQGMPISRQSMSEDGKDDHAYGSNRPRMSSVADALLAAGAGAPHVSPTGLQAVLPPIVSVAAGAGYSAFVDTHGRLYTCGIQDGPLGHDVALLARLLGAKAGLPQDLAMGLLASTGAAAQGTADGNMPAMDAVARALTAALDFAGGGATTAATDLLVPIQLLAGLDPTREQAISVACGELHAVVATSTGAAYSWGWGGTGALGHGDLLDRSIPTRVSALPRDVLQVAAGAAHTLAVVENRLTGAREAYGFGSNVHGQLPGVPPPEETVQAKSRGNVVMVPRLLKLPLPPPDDTAEPGAPAPAPSTVAAGAWHSAIVLSNYTLLVSGSGRDGELGLTEGGAGAAVKVVAEWDKERAKRAAGGAKHAGGTKSRLAKFGAAMGTMVSFQKAPPGTGGPGGQTTPHPHTPGTGQGADTPAGHTPITGSPQRPAPQARVATLVASTLANDGRDLPAPPSPPPGDDDRRPLLGAGGAVMGNMARALSPVREGLTGGSEDGPEPGTARGPGARPALVRPTATEGGESRPGGVLDDNDLRPRSISMAHRYFSRKEGSGRVLDKDGPGPSPWDSDSEDDDVDAAVGGAVLDALDQPGPGVAAHGRAGASAMTDLHGVGLKSGGSNNSAGGVDGPSSSPSTVGFVPGSGGEAAVHSTGQTGRDKDGHSTEPEAGAGGAHKPRTMVIPGPWPGAVGLGDAAPADGSASPLTGLGESQDRRGLLALDKDRDKEKDKDSRPLASTMAYGALPVVSLLRREVRAVACGNGYTIATVATEWMRNEDAVRCTRCAQDFTVTRRRHHCRQCGGVFCDGCSSHRIPLLNLGYIAPVRICDGCFARRMSEA